MTIRRIPTTFDPTRQANERQISIDLWRQQDYQGTSEERMKEWSDLLDLDHALQGETADPWILEHKDKLAANLPASGETRRALLEQVHLDAV